jgi:hypothetical protein
MVDGSSPNRETKTLATIREGSKDFSGAVTFEAVEKNRRAHL